MLKDELATWKNYLLTQRCEDRNMHITRTALIHLVTRATNRVSEFPPPGFEPGTDSCLSLTTQDLVNTSPGGVLKQLALQSLRQEMLVTIDKGWAAVIINGIENQDQGPDEPRRRRGQDRQWNCDEHQRRHRRR